MITPSRQLSEDGISSDLQLPAAIPSPWRDGAAEDSPGEMSLDLPARCSSRFSQLQAQWGFGEDSRHKPSRLDFSARKKAAAVGISSAGRAQGVFPHRNILQSQGVGGHHPPGWSMQCKYFGVPLAEE